MTPHDEALAELRAFAKRTMAISVHLGTLQDAPKRLRPVEIEAWSGIVAELQRLLEVERAAIQRRMLEAVEPVGSA